MKIRTLSKKDSLHLINLGSLVIAWGVTNSYFELVIPNIQVANLEYFLLAPAFLTEKLLSFFGHYQIIGDYSRMLLILWGSYFLAASQLSFLLMVKNYDNSELRSWYLSKRSF